MLREKVQRSISFSMQHRRCQARNSEPTIIAAQNVQLLKSSPSNHEKNEIEQIQNQTLAVQAAKVMVMIVRMLRQQQHFHHFQINHHHTMSAQLQRLLLHTLHHQTTMSAQVQSMLLLLHPLLLLINIQFQRFL